jgi:hypothetical protein
MRISPAKVPSRSQGFEVRSQISPDDPDDDEVSLLSGLADSTVDVDREALI